MFDYAIGHYKKHPPSARFLASWIVSCLGHVAVVLILLEYPQLLRSGMYQWFRQPPPSLSQTRSWRTLTYMGSQMEMPPVEVLKKYIYDWNRAKTKGEGPPAIHVNLTPTRVVPFPVKPMPRTEPAVVSSNPAIPPKGEPVTTVPLTTSASPPGEAKGATTVGPPVSAADGTPKQIPKGVTDPATSTATTGSGAAAGSTTNSQGRPAGQTAKPADTQTSIQGGVLFDTKGFALDEYANLVKERVWGNWSIPSNLRYSHASTTVLFYIGKDGQVSGARIEVSSGVYSLDIAALMAVTGSSPFPVLPKGFPAERVGARFVFIYSERQ